MASAPISTRNLAGLPSPSRLRQICKALALIEAIYAWDYCFHTYDVFAPGNLAYMQDHEGGMFAIWFDDNGASIRGFELRCALGSRERVPSEEDLFAGLPDSLAPGARDAYAHGGDRLTFVIWSGSDGLWQTGNLTYALDEPDDPDGSETCLWMLADDRANFFEYVVQHWEARPELEADVASMFDVEPITAQRIKRFNPDADVEAVLALAYQVSWPRRGPAA